MKQQAYNEWVQYLKAFKALKEDTKGFVPNLKTLNTGCYVVWDVISEKLVVVENVHPNGALRFASEEDAEASIKKHPQEWAVYLGVPSASSFERFLKAVAYALESILQSIGELLRGDQ